MPEGSAAISASTAKAPPARESFWANHGLLFAGEDGKIPRSVRKKLLCRMHIGDFVRTLYEDELQNAAARRENMHLMKGESLPVGICDDHELHLAAHRRAALDYAYDKLRRRDPAAARALEAHIAAHTEKLNLAKEKQNA